MLKFILILLRSKNRLIENPPVLNLTACRDFCDNKHGKLVDGDLFDELQAIIDDAPQGGAAAATSVRKKKVSAIQDGSQNLGAI